jgi:hypothetical protein
MTTPISTIPSNFPIKKTIRSEIGCQTKQMPIIAIEWSRLDCIHGPYIANPLDIAIADPEFPHDRKITNPTRDQSTQTDFEHIETPFVEYKSQEVQTDFTSFTRPTHYHCSDSHFEKFLILDDSQGLEPNEAKRKAEAFNEDFFTRYGNLFSIKFIMTYFHSRFAQSKL